MSILFTTSDLLVVKSTVRNFLAGETDAFELHLLVTYNLSTRSVEMQKPWQLQPFPHEDPSECRKKLHCLQICFHHLNCNTWKLFYLQLQEDVRCISYQLVFHFWVSHWCQVTTGLVKYLCFWNIVDWGATSEQLLCASSFARLISLLDFCWTRSYWACKGTFSHLSLV